MAAFAGAASREAATTRGPLAGRAFVHPAFDYLVIGGGLSLVVIGVLFAPPRLATIGGLRQGLESMLDSAALPWVVLLCSVTHFSASTVRLYTKPGAVASLPFLTLGFPLVAFGVLTLCVFRAQDLGPSLQALYISWSPYHYAAQAYGLAVMYSYRSGCLLSDRDRRLLRWTSLLPFLYALISTPGAGIHWVLPGAALQPGWVQSLLEGTRTALTGLGFAAPLALLLLGWRGVTGRLPLIGPLLLFTNAVWWFVLPAVQAFIWATFFHGIQYLAIVAIFHVRDRRADPDDRRGTFAHVARFYGACLLLGYGLFNCLPRAYVLAGAGLTESLLLVTAAINLHHFIVDGFIWRLGRQDPNRAIVDSGAPLAGEPA
jgi:hypothetical protein